MGGFLSVILLIVSLVLQAEAQEKFVKVFKDLNPETSTVQVVQHNDFAGAVNVLLTDQYRPTEQSEWNKDLDGDINWLSMHYLQQSDDYNTHDFAEDRPVTSLFTHMTLVS